MHYSRGVIQREREREREMARLLPAGSTLMFLSKDTMPGVGSMNTTPSVDPSVNSNDFIYKFNASMAITVVVVIAAFLFMSLFLFYLKNRWTLESRIISVGQQQQEAATGLPNPHGLDTELVEKFPLMRYGSAKLAANAGKLGSTDCSVCLTEFEDDEKLRILPNCGHGFHADCIDMWLLSHSTCPLCRINLVPSSPDQSTIMATDPQTQAQPEDHPPHINVADALSGDDPQSLRETRGISSRLVERLAVRALSRNSDSFRKAAQDAELLSAGEVERDGSTSSRRWKILRTAWSSELHQQTSTSNTGEKDDPNLLSNMKTGKEVAADDSMQQSGNYVFASDRWGSARSSHASDEGYFSAAKSDSNLFTEVAQQTERNEETGWVSIEIDATTEPSSSLEKSRQFHTQHIVDPTKVEPSQAEAQI